MIAEKRALFLLFSFSFFFFLFRYACRPALQRTIQVMKLLLNPAANLPCEIQTADLQRSIRCLAWESKTTWNMQKHCNAYFATAIAAVLWLRASMVRDRATLSMQRQ